MDCCLVKLLRRFALGGLGQRPEIADHPEAEGGEGQRSANPGQGSTIERERNAKPCETCAMSGERRPWVTVWILGHLLSFPGVQSLLKREYCLPVVFHADDGPACCRGFMKGLVDFAEMRLPINVFIDHSSSLAGTECHLESHFLGPSQKR